MPFTRKPYKDLALLLCLMLLLSQIALAQQAPKFTGNAWSQFSVNGKVVGAKAVCDDDDVDNDDDGLIELCYLEDVDAMRYQPDGTGYKASADVNKITTGCKVGGCDGYELVRDLDFNDYYSYSSTANKVIYTTNSGWEPIGNDSFNFFNSTFEGNGHTISNLMINRSSNRHIGLFGRIGNSSKISNIGLLDVDIRGYENVGGLVGWNNSGSVANSYATGSVMGNEDVGGLVGESKNSITNSYATGSISGNTYLGGLVGWNNRGSITNSYATGSVNGSSDIGGLVALHTEGSITNSYATGRVTSFFGTREGGLVGDNEDDDNINNSYWDTVTSEISDSDGGTGQTTTALTGPTDATGIYENWNDKDWDFGTRNQYPTVKYASGDDTNNPACRKLDDEEPSQRPVCGTLLPGQKSAPPIITTVMPPLSPLPLGTSTTWIVVIEDVDSDSISVQLGSSDITVVTATIVAINNANYTFKLTAQSTGTAVITVTASDDEESSKQEMFTILVDAEPTGEVLIELDDSNDNAWRLVATPHVEDENGLDNPNYQYQWYRGNTKVGTSSNIYPMENDNTDRAGGTEYKVDVGFVDNIGQATTFSAVYTIPNQAPMIRSVTPERLVYNEGERVLVTTKASDANRDVLTYTLSVNQGAERINEFNRVSGGATLNFDVPPKWIEDADIPDKTEPLQLEIAVSDGSEITMQTTSVVVTKVDNDTVRQPSISLVDGDPDEFKLGQINTALDPDGGRNDGNYNLNYQWQRCLATDPDCSTGSSDWDNIAGETSLSLTVPDSLKMEGNIFRVQILYTDGQGYRRTDFFSRERLYRSDPDISIRAKVFLEGPLQ